MNERGVTRRSLLSATAGALVAGGARPGSALGAILSAPEPALFEQRLGGVHAGTRTVTLRRNADLVGVEWQGPSTSILLRTRTARGGWGSWASATACTSAGRDGPGASTGALVGDPVWTGGTRELQLHLTRALSGVRLRMVDVSGGYGARRRATLLGAVSASALPLASPVLAAGPGQPPIIARQAWAHGKAHPAVAPEYGAVRMAFVHHTENPNGYTPGEVPSMLLAIYAFHRYTRGWDDIGYNFVIDRFGRIFEARAGGIDEPVVGAQAGGYNLASTGVAVLGSFMSVPISLQARQALERLLAWKLALHGVPPEGRVTVRVNPAGASYSRFPAGAHVALPRIAGHRDADTTDCPGNALYGELRALRHGVTALAGRPARATLALMPPQSAPATAPASAVSTLAGRLELLDGTPLVNAPIVVQERSVARKGELVSETTVGQAVTGAEGEWSLPVAISRTRLGAWLRALYVGPSAAAPATGSATVSEPLHVPGTPSPAPAPGATSAPSAPTPAPAAAP
jgi:hypothetical protein